MSDSDFDLVVLGGGPAGQKAAIQGARAGSRVLLVDRARNVGGACLRAGTIPSKALRESALALARLRQVAGGALEVTLPERPLLASLTARSDQIIATHEQCAESQLARSGVSVWHGDAEFTTPHELDVRRSDGSRARVCARWFVIATGSHPRTPSHIPLDHQHVFDSDSILSMPRVPKSLIVIGSDSVALEYATIFAALGASVTWVERKKRPLALFDAEIARHFMGAFKTLGGRVSSAEELGRVAWNGEQVEVELSESGVLRAEKALCALGRRASVSGLGLERAGVRLNEHDFIQIDANARTNVPHIYAVGDVAGPPALASAAMEQGRRAVCHALGIPLRDEREVVPVSIYGIPEIASVGLTEDEAVQKYGEAAVGRASFGELTRGQITGSAGLLKIVCSPRSGRLLGAHAVGENAAELVHLAQIAMRSRARYDVFVDAVFNFPTFGEAYHVAALDILARERCRFAAE